MKKTVKYIGMAMVGMAIFALAQTDQKVPVRDVVNAAAENVTIEITELNIEDNVYTPYYQVETARDHERGASAKWIRVGVEYTTEGGWIDELTVRFAANSPEISGKTPVRMVKEVNYLNVAPGDHVGYVYLHPSYVERYEIDSPDLDVSVKMYIEQPGPPMQLRDVRAFKETTNNAEAGWTDRRDPKLAVGHLLSRAETPFWFIDYDNREIINTGGHWHETPIDTANGDG